MSIDGVVFCDCRETDLAVAPPCPVIREGAWIYAAPGYETRQREIEAWAEMACDHPRFRLVEHQVRNWAMLDAMAGYGGEATFPMIHAALPTHNGGSLDPADAARCVAEVDRLGALMSEGSMVAIVDANDGTVVFADPDGSLVASPRHHEPDLAIFGFDERGAVQGLTAVAGRPMTSTWLGDDAVVRVVDADGSVLFAARELVQERDGEDWIFRDERTGATVRHCSPVGWWDGMPQESQPHRMRAEIRPIDIDDYLAGVAELRELFQTSIRTGRPIYWI